MGCRDSSTEFLTRASAQVRWRRFLSLTPFRCVDSGLTVSIGLNRCCDCRSRFVRSPSHTEYVPVMRLESPAAAMPSLRVRHMWFFMLARVAPDLNHARLGTMRSTSGRYGFGGQASTCMRNIWKIDHLIPIVWMLPSTISDNGPRNTLDIVCVCPCGCFFTDVRAKIPRDEPGWVQNE